MMETTILFFFLISFNLGYSIPTNVTIRNATQKDLPAIFSLDRIIAYEYFLPIFNKGYTHLPLGRDPTYFIELELERDKKWLPECVDSSAESIWIAYDQDKNKLAGFIVAYQSSYAKVEIDLLLILKEYRKRGIGKRLVYHAIDSFPNVATCGVHVLRFANEETLAFYKTIGFVNQGIPTVDEIAYGTPYKDIAYYLTYDVAAQHTINFN